MLFSYGFKFQLWKALQLKISSLAIKVPQSEALSIQTPVGQGQRQGHSKEDGPGWQPRSQSKRSTNPSTTGRQLQQIMPLSVRWNLCPVYRYTQFSSTARSLQPNHIQLSHEKYHYPIPLYWLVHRYQCNHYQ